MIRLDARGQRRRSCETHESNVIFVKFHTRLQSTDFVVVLVLVLVPRLPIKFLTSFFEDEHEDEDEKN